MRKSRVLCCRCAFLLSLIRFPESEWLGASTPPPPAPPSPFLDERAGCGGEKTRAASGYFGRVSCAPSSDLVPLQRSPMLKNRLALGAGEIPRHVLAGCSSSFPVAPCRACAFLRPFPVGAPFLVLGLACPSLKSVKQKQTAPNDMLRYGNSVVINGGVDE